MSEVAQEPDRIVTVATIDYRVEPRDWIFATEEAERIDEHWARLLVETPQLFDGRILLAHRLAVDPRDGGTLRGACLETGYKPFIAWRDFGHPGVPLYNCFAMPALRADDGAFVLGAMSASTANAGKLYFPAGTPEPSDTDAEGRVQLTENILRELKEETGLLSSDVTLDPGWTIVFSGPRVACMRVARSRMSFEALQDVLARHNSSQAAPELDRLVAVRDTGDLDPTRMPLFMRRYLDHALRGRGPAGGAQAL